MQMEAATTTTDTDKSEMEPNSVANDTITKLVMSKIKIRNSYMDILTYEEAWRGKEKYTYN